MSTIGTVVTIKQKVPGISVGKQTAILRGKVQAEIYLPIPLISFCYQLMKMALLETIL